MADNILVRAKRAWHVFREKSVIEQAVLQNVNASGMIQYGYNPFALARRSNERSIITAAYVRISMDVASYDIKHVRLGANDKFESVIKSSLHTCLNVEANKDQTGRAFLQDVVMNLFDEGVVAIVPVESDFSPLGTDSYEIYTLRVGKIIDWYPDYVRVELYNDLRGVREMVLLPKRNVAIVTNPLYHIMNEPNSTLRRLVEKLNLLDMIDSQNSSGKLDLIIQLPFAIKTQARQDLADDRLRAIEEQLVNSKYGIAYLDGTEKITQLNRPVVNNLLEQVTSLTISLYNQLGITAGVFDGTADERAMLNYYNRSVEPIVTSIIEEMNRKFISKTARTQGQSLMGFRDMFKLIPANELATLADSLTRNEIVTSNDMRSILGMMPSDAPNASELRNKNMPPPSEGSTSSVGVVVPDTSEYDSIVEDTIAGLEAQINSVLEQLESS